MTEKNVTFSESLFAIRDIKVGKFGTPFVAQNDDDAMRIFNDLVLGSNDSLLAKHPEDFSLYYLCGYSAVEGVCSVDLPRHLMDAQVVINNYRSKLRLTEGKQELSNSLN